MKLAEALFQEPSFATSTGLPCALPDKDAQWVQDVTAAYNSQEFKDYAHKRFVGYKYPAAWGEGAAAASAASTAAASGASAAK